MDDQVKLLKQQVVAAEFLLRNLTSQLREAEERVASRQQGGESHGDPPQEASSRSLRLSKGGGNVETRSTNVENIPDGAGSVEGATTSNSLFGIPENDFAENDDDAPAEDATDGTSQIQLPSIDVGTSYRTLEDIKNAVTGHAISQGWTCGVNKRDKTRILLKCRTSIDCPFHLRAEQYAEGARICALKSEHNCEFKPDQSHVPRSHASSLKFLREQLPNIMTIDANTTAEEISDAIFHRFGTRVSLKQCRHMKKAPKRKRAISLMTCSSCGATGHNKKTCGRITEHPQTPSE